MFGMVAAFGLMAPTSMAGTVATATAHHTTARPAAQRSAATPTRLLADTAPAAAATKGSTSGLPTSYTVQSGDTLSKIAGHFYNNSVAWPVLYQANQGKIASPNVIIPGQVLNVPVEPSTIPAAPSQDSASQPAPASQQTSQTTSEQSAGATSGTPGGSFGQCVVNAESGGNPQVMNASGHYGLYQFSASTWAAYGGNPADFGNASVAEQNQVFSTAIANGGASNWSAYDGC